MSKYDYDDYLEDDPMFTPCIHCGCLDFYMEWGENIYRCSNCDSPIDPKSTNNSKKEKPKTKLKKFKDEEI
jgi:hypothetical protein